MTSIDYREGDDGIAVLTVNLSDRPQNLITPDLLVDLLAALDQVSANDAVVGAIITSGKTNGFVAGADLQELLALMDSGATAKQGADWSMTASRKLRRIETCGKPIVAAINGHALGGGLELALACHHRVALRDNSIKLGLPEVTLGLLPGGGGTQRLPRIIGIEAALPLLLNGDTFDPERALALGIVDSLADDAEALMALARQWLLSRPPAQQPWDRKGFATPGGAGPLAPFAQTAFTAGTSRLKATRRQYPAPHAILSAVYEGTQVPFETSLAIESKYFGRLIANPVARNLVNNFLSQAAMRKRGRLENARSVNKLGVLGAGMMGAGIAHVAAAKGIDVVLLDRTRDDAERGLRGIRAVQERSIQKGQIERENAEEIARRITPTADYEDLEGSDLVIEAVFEDRTVKQEATGHAEPRLAAGGFFASNTSTLSITSLALNSLRPSRFIGLHFFSPVERMPLVEVIRGKQTSNDTLTDALAFVGRLGKTAIVVNDSPGFYTSRVFCTYIDEAMAMLEEGIAPALIENAARIAGFPAPALAVADEVSLSLQKRVIDQAIADNLDERFLRSHSHQVVERMNALGRLGRKAGKGFYDYHDDSTKSLWPGLADLFPHADVQPDAEDVAKRLLYIQALESQRCLDEGVINDAETANVGSLLGIGYPAWTGGALAMPHTVGKASFIADCERFSASVGPRFAVPRTLRDDRMQAAE